MGWDWADVRMGTGVGGIWTPRHVAKLGDDDDLGGVERADV